MLSGMESAQRQVPALTQRRILAMLRCKEAMSHCTFEHQLEKWQALLTLSRMAFDDGEMALVEALIHLNDPREAHA